MRRERSLLFPLISILLLFSAVSYAQLWSGIISPSRAVDWTKAGISGGIPSGSWTNCTTTACNNLFGGAVTTANINAAIASAPSNSVVRIPAGTFNLADGIVFNAPNSNPGNKSNVVLRGQGADSTFLVFTSGTGGGWYHSLISVGLGALNGIGSEQNVCNWTAGYSKGTTIITLGTCGKGSLNNLHVGSILVLDQIDELSDTATIWNCANSGGSNACSGTIQGGGARTDGGSVNGISTRSQQQSVIVTNINGSQITISPGLYMPNWRSGQAPQGWFASNVMSSDGVENLTVDNTANHGQYNIMLDNCNGCWISGVRSIKAQRTHFNLSLLTHAIAQNNYAYLNQTSGSVSYGLELMDTSDSLIVNNIFQQVTDSDPSCTGACEGNVIAYNFDVYNVYASNYYIVPPFYQHSAGDALNLWEGNIGPGYGADSIHGTHHFETVYRNILPGWQLHCQGGDCRAQTIPINLMASSRYFNIINNVMGQPGYHNTYTCAALTGNTFCPQSYQVGGYDKMIYELNNTPPGYNNINGFCTSIPCGATSDYDPQTSAYLMRWGNWDTVNNASRFVSGEVPTGLAIYANAVPSICTSEGSGDCPASFYYSSKPSWFGSVAWPLAGPDVSSGNLGNCSGGTYAGMAATNSSQCTGGSVVTAWAGHANANPAMLCYLNTMGGPADGTGSALTFNADSCYGSNPHVDAPTGLAAVVN